MLDCVTINSSKRYFNFYKHESMLNDYTAGVREILYFRDQPKQN